VVALSTLSYKVDDNLLFSASCDGSLALWDVNTGDMVCKCQMMQDEKASHIICADVDQIRSIIYLGMATGHVIGYNVEDMIKSASTGGVCPVPSGRFMAHEGGVTAVKCAGEGTLSRSNPGASSSILLTGGSDGIVKQW
jgi:WD40 repeat protein